MTVEREKDRKQVLKFDVYNFLVIVFSFLYRPSEFDYLEHLHCPNRHKTNTYKRKIEVSFQQQICGLKPTPPIQPPPPQTYPKSLLTIIIIGPQDPYEDYRFDTYYIDSVHELVMVISDISSEWVFISIHRTKLIVDSIVGYMRDRIFNYKKYYVYGSSVKGGVLMNNNAFKLLKKYSAVIAGKRSFDESLRYVMDSNNIKINEFVKDNKYTGFMDENLVTILKMIKDGEIKSIDKYYSISDLDNDEKYMIDHVTRIPKIIHQFRSDPDFTFLEKCRKKFQICGYEYHLWEESDLKKELKGWYVQGLQKYQILLKYGGIFIDSKMECLKVFDDVINDAFDSKSDIAVACKNEIDNKGVISEKFIASSRNNFVLFDILAKIMMKKGPIHPEIYLQDLVHQKKNRIFVLNSKKILPLSKKDDQNDILEVYRKITTYDSYTVNWEE